MNELNIAKTLTAKRKEKGITQDKLASYLGVSKASVSKWETGQSYPDIAFLPEIAAYFNISIDELIDYQPQMIKEDIEKLYKRLSADFVGAPFDRVMSEVRESVKKYYSCFPLLFHMGVLMVNHQNLAGDESKDVLFEAVELFKRIREESGDFGLIEQANMMEATCFLMMGDGTSMIELLDNGNAPITSRSILLAGAYFLNGETEKANEISQVGAYQGVLYLLQDLLNIYRFKQDSKEKSETIMNRILQLAGIFDLDTLQPGIMFSVYLTIAEGLALQKDTEGALGMLRKYVELAAGGAFPLRLHGDNFFDQIDGWLSRLDLGGGPPRNDAVIKQGIYDSVARNPAFAELHNEFEYKNIIELFRALAEEA